VKQGRGAESADSPAMQMRTARVLHVINGLRRGGAETTLMKLVAADRRPSRFHVVSLTDLGEYGAAIRAMGATVTCFHMKGDRIPAAVIRKLTKLIRTEKPAVVQTWLPHSNLIGGLAAKLAGVPVCWGIRQANLSREANRPRTLLVAKACAWLSSVVPSRIVSCSQRAVSVHRNFGYRGSFEVIPNGFDISAFSVTPETRASMRSELGIDGNTFVLGHVGRYDVHKDYPNLLRACGILAAEGKQFHLVMSGDGIDDANPDLQILIAKHGLINRVTLLGVRRDIPRLMAAIDLFVLSSLAEAFPNVVAEAMAANVPCVVTDVGDAAIIVGSAGWIVPPRDPVQLAQAIARAVNHPHADRQRIGLEGKHRVQSLFSMERMTDAYNRVWADAVRGRQECAA
jgi:glycosyltransferase involved in cell wall biosynthesis